MWEGFKDLIFMALQALHSPIGDWGMAIIIATVIFRLVLTPCSTSQTKSSFQMQKLQPKLNAVKEKYADNPVRQQEETQKIMAESKYNPIIGCLPVLLQMPIFIALFQVLREMGDRLGDEGYCFYNLVPNLVTSPSEALTQGFLFFIPYLILIIIFAVCTFIPMVLQQMNNTDAQQKRQTLIMSGVMAVFMIFIGWSTPAGVLLFWGTSSIVAIIIQQVYLAYLKKKDAQQALVEEVVVKPEKVEVVAKKKKARPKKKR